MWDYVSEPQPALDGRRVHVPQGRTLGGSSSMNGMIYIRGDVSFGTKRFAKSLWKDEFAQAAFRASATPYFAPSWLSSS